MKIFSFGIQNAQKLQPNKEFATNSIKMQPALKEDTFQKSVSFGNKFYSISNSYWNRNIGEYRDTSGIANYEARRVICGLLVPITEKMKADILPSGKSVFDAVIEKGDELKTVSKKTLEFVNSKYRTEYKDMSGRELAFIILTKDIAENGAAGQVRLMQDLKKTVGEKEYNELLGQYIETGDVDLNYILKDATAVLEPHFVEKYEQIQPLLDQNPNQEGIENILNELRLNPGPSRTILHKFSPLEFGAFLTYAKSVDEYDKTDVRSMLRKDQLLKSQLEKIKNNASPEIYDGLLEKCCTGEISTQELVNELRTISKKANPFKDFDGDDWNSFYTNLQNCLITKNKG